MPIALNNGTASLVRLANFHFFPRDEYFMRLALREAARAPEHGQHTEEILLELDVDWDDIAKAKDLKAIL